MHECVFLEHADYVNANWRVHVIVLSIIGALGVIAIIVVAAVARLCIIHRRLDKCAENGNESDAFLAGGSDSASGSSSCCSELDGLKFDLLISHGRYGDVYRGLLGPSEVAVKVTSSTLHSLSLHSTLYTDNSVCVM
jgi:hypothetical protein